MVKKYLEDKHLVKVNKDVVYHVFEGNTIKTAFILDNTKNVNSIKIYLYDNSNLSLLIYSKNSFNFILEIFLMGDNNQLNIHNLGLLNKVSSIKNIHIIHKGNNNFSRIQSFNLLLSGAKISEDGIITIKKNTHSSDTYLSQRALLMDSNCIADLKPILEINSMETKAGHGSASGFVGDDQLFYLMSRGLKKEDAMQMIVLSYIHPLISNYLDLDYNFLEDIKHV